MSRNSERTDKKLWTDNAGGRPIQRFEAYNEEEEAEWIARQVEGLIGGRGSVLTRRADDGDGEDGQPFRPRDIAVMYRMNAQSRAIEESFLRYGIRYQLVGGDAVLQPARGQGRAGVPPGPAVRHGLGQLRADHQRAGAGDRRQDDRGAPRVARAATGCTTWEAIERGGPGRGRGPRSRGRGSPWPSSPR